jgi:hypothetical protein
MQFKVQKGWWWIHWKKISISHRSRKVCFFFVRKEEWGGANKIYSYMYKLPDVTQKSIAIHIEFLLQNDKFLVGLRFKQREHWNVEGKGVDRFLWNWKEFKQKSKDEKPQSTKKCYHVHVLPKKVNSSIGMRR